SNSILFPLTLYFVYFSKEIVAIMLGENWLEAVMPLQIMFLVLPFSISNKMADSAIRAKGLIYKNVIRKCIYIVILLLSTFILGYFYGIIGAAIAVTGSYIFNYFLMINLVQRIFKKSFKEIFYAPLKDAIKLTSVIGVLLLFYHTLAQIFDINQLIGFFIFSLILGGVTCCIILIQPTLLGSF